MFFQGFTVGFFITIPSGFYFCASFKDKTEQNKTGIPIVVSYVA